MITVTATTGGRKDGHSQREQSDSQGLATGCTLGACCSETHLLRWPQRLQSRLQWPAPQTEVGWSCSDAFNTTTQAASGNAQLQTGRLKTHIHTWAAACAAACTLPPVHTLAAARATASDVAVAAPLMAWELAWTITVTESGGQRRGQ